MIKLPCIKDGCCGYCADSNHDKIKYHGPECIVFEGVCAICNTVIKIIGESEPDKEYPDRYIEYYVTVLTKKGEHSSFKVIHQRLRVLNYYMLCSYCNGPMFHLEHNVYNQRIYCGANQHDPDYYNSMSGLAYFARRFVTARWPEKYDNRRPSEWIFLSGHASCVKRDKVYQQREDILKLRLLKHESDNRKKNFERYNLRMRKRRQPEVTLKEYAKLKGVKLVNC